MTLTVPRVIIFLVCDIVCLVQNTFFPSFVFSKHFILVRVVVDPESILGTLGTKRKLQSRWNSSLSQPHGHTLIHA